jgi:hypothetical protein
VFGYTDQGLGIRAKDIGFKIRIQDLGLRI